MADERTPEKKQADDNLAALSEVTVTPELWLKGVKVDASAFGHPPYRLVKRTFATRADQTAAKAGYDAMCASGCSPEKAYRIWFCEEGAGANSVRDQLLKRFGL